MQIESNRDSTVENEETIAWYRLTGIEVRTALASPLDGDLIRNPGKSYPTDAGSSNKPYQTLMEHLGERKVDWGLD